MTTHSKHRLPASSSPHGRPRLTVKSEPALALLPTLTVLVMFVLVERLSQQRLLFASLASSAFLIYLDPRHEMNSIRTLVMAHVSAAVCGMVAYYTIDPGYAAASSAMVAVIVIMISLDAMHPPAVSTALSFGFRTSPDNKVMLFGLALAITVRLVLLQRPGLWV